MDGLVSKINAQVKNIGGIYSLQTSLAKMIAKGTGSMLDEAGHVAAKGLKESIYKNWTANSPGVSTGALANSFKPERLDNNSVLVGSNLPYAGIHETGGTISPKVGKYLAIPLKNAVLMFSDINTERVYNGKYLVQKVTIRAKNYLEEAQPTITKRVYEYYTKALAKEST